MGGEGRMEALEAISHEQRVQADVLRERGIFSIEKS